MRLILTSTVVLAAASAVFADDYTSPGGSIPDFAAGVPGVRTIPFNVTESGPVATVSVTLTQFSHTWAGDIIATLSGPGGTPIADLLRRPEDTVGFAAIGDSSDFNGTYRFIDGGASLATGLLSAVVPSGDYAASTRTSTTTGNVPVVLNTTFFNAPSAGTWTLTLSDNAGADTGTIGSATLSITLIPEPATLGLLAAGAVLAQRRRRC